MNANACNVHCPAWVCSRENFATVLQAIKATAALGWWCLFEGLQNVEHFDAGFSSGHEGNIFLYLALAARSVLPVIDPGKVKICKMLDGTPVFAQPTFALIIADSMQPSNLPLATFNGKQLKVPTLPARRITPEPCCVHHSPLRLSPACTSCIFRRSA